MRESINQKRSTNQTNKITPITKVRQIKQIKLDSMEHEKSMRKRNSVKDPVRKKQEIVHSPSPQPALNSNPPGPRQRRLKTKGNIIECMMKLKLVQTTNSVHKYTAETTKSMRIIRKHPK